MSLENIIASLLSGVTASLGLGGGTIFLIYLSTKNFEQMKAQGLNLLFFIPCAVISIIFNAKSKLIIWKVAIPMALGGFLGAFLGSYIAEIIGGNLLRKFFAVFLIITGVLQILSLRKKNNT